MNKRTRWIMIVSAGVIAALPWWGATGLLLLFCFVPLLFVEEFQHRVGEEIISVIPYAFVFFLCWNIGATWWMARIHLTGGLSVIILNSAIMCMVFLVYTWIKRATGKGSAIFVIIWLAFEFLHHRGDLSWPWLILGNGIASDIRIVQWYEFTGVTGGSLWVLIVNSILFTVLKHYIFFRTVMTQFVRITLLVLAILIPPALSYNIFRTYNEQIDETGFLLLQTDLDPYNNKYSGISNSQRLDSLLMLAGDKMDDEIQYIVSPETAVDSIWITGEADKMVERIFGFMQQYPDKGLVLGATAFKSTNQSEKSFVTRSDAEGNYFDVYNSALLFFSGKPLMAYHKYYLANGVEQVPFQHIFRFMGKLSVNMGGVSGSLKQGIGPEVFRSPLDDTLAMGILICFESAYGEYAAKMVRKGAELLIVITNDGWFSKTGAYGQPLRLSQIRAVENRRSIVRSANTGITCHISQTGEIVDRLEMNSEGALFVRANKNSRITFFTSSGDYIGRIALFFSVLLVLNVLVKKNIYPG